MVGALVLTAITGLLSHSHSKRDGISWELTNGGAIKVSTCHFIYTKENVTLTIPPDLYL